MIRRPLLAAAGAFAAVLAAPLAAQEALTPSAEPQEMDDVAAMMAGIFPKAEPLSPAQEAVLPLAGEVVAQVFPEGTYARMMGDTMQPMMESMIGSFTEMPANQIAKLTGLYGEDFAQLDGAKIDAAMAIIDPAFEERSQEIGRVTIGLVTDVMTEIEPAYRAGLARAYAVRFSEAELADLKRYFATPVGAKYARESMLIYADPQVMSAMNELMPAIMNLMPRMIDEIGAASARLPEPRRFSQLSVDEQARLAELLGVSAQALREAEPEEWDESVDYEGYAPETAPQPSPGEVATPAA
ncbi:MAG: DUF2059 domain-containing protein [Erythrobacter sp.]|jgi:hypothetical protein|nr:DUF2059 domain-containing protein [Erythrobacter sp.]